MGDDPTDERGIPTRGENLGVETTVKMPDGKTFIFEEDDPIDERGIPTRGENLGVETTVKMQDGKTFIFEEDDPTDERGIPTRGENLSVETTVKMQDGKTFIFEEDDMDEPPERGAVPPAGYDPKSMDHNSAEYMNLKMQALEETPTPVNPLPSAKT